jgi:hypothetical protein
MKPKKNDLTFEKTEQYRAIVIWNTDVVSDFTHVNLATDEDLASMGLVTQVKYDEIHARLKNIIDCFHGFDPEPAPAEPAKTPQPHVWEVGQYAKDNKTGTIMKVKEQNLDTYYLKNNCTHVPEPPRPILSMGFHVGNGKAIQFSGCWMSIDAWLAAINTDPDNWMIGTKDMLIALAEWRKLVGRDV